MTTTTTSKRNNNLRITTTRKCSNYNGKDHATLATTPRQPKSGLPILTLPPGRTYQLAAQYANDAMVSDIVPNAKGEPSPVRTWAAVL